jgi:CBS domain-containing protein
MGAEHRMRSRRTIGPRGEERAELVLGPGASEYVSACDATWIPIVECMKDPICLSPELSLEAAATFFLEAGVAAAPVVGLAGELLGVVTRRDVELRRAKATVRDVMTAPALSVPETATLGEAAAILVEKRFRLLPVVSGRGEVVGVVSPFDLLAWVI